jgi:ornithine decarboxylase
LSFHVGSQTTNFQNYVQAIHVAADIFKEARLRGFDKMNLVDIGGGFPRLTTPTSSRSRSWRKS